MLTGYSFWSQQDQNGSGWLSKKKTEILQQQRFRATTCVVVLSFLGARRVKLCAFSSEDDDDGANVLSNEDSRGYAQTCQSHIADTGCIVTTELFL
ncbi:hypothetical protein HID58_019171 [Brassica napus]|uniref:Uncharacterized protein n=1 Tax=Brassica napus TaxID=3708 RepID=A0ABQ8DBZ3_BRANA|nr:hypothetical protein HID58_019171 [Brassica napus]